MTIVLRSQWGARPPKDRTRISGPVRGVARHYEGTTLGNYRHDSCAGRVRSIQNYHMDHNGWSDIAYSFLVCIHGTVFEGRGPGIRTAANGTNDANAHYYAGCIIIGPGDPLTDQAKAGWLEGRSWLQGAGGAGSETPPHSQLFSTACPGDAFRNWNIGDFHAAVIPVPPGAGAPIVGAPGASPDYYTVEATVASMPTIQQGNKGQFTRILQGLLVANGRNVTVDGDFGGGTRAALVDFQHATGLAADGVCGAQSWRRLLCV